MSNRVKEIIGLLLIAIAVSILSDSLLQYFLVWIFTGLGIEFFLASKNGKVR